jgi:hypothetical protein
VRTLHGGERLTSACTGRPSAAGEAARSAAKANKVRTEESWSDERESQP